MSPDSPHLQPITSLVCSTADMAGDCHVDPPMRGYFPFFYIFVRCAVSLARPLMHLSKLLIISILQLREASLLSEDFPHHIGLIVYPRLS